MYRLPDTNHPLDFPNDFTTTPEGLLALGGNLLPQTLVNAYSKGIFPWFNQEDPLLWWHPNPRLVIFPKSVHISRRMRQILKKTRYNLSNLTQKTPFCPPECPNPEYILTFNQNFPLIIENCKEKRGPNRTGTWITPQIKESYIQLHVQGYAHSVEVWNLKGDLVGGLYGVALGRVFFGESMFSHQPNTSKIALYKLCEFLAAHDFELLDCQVESDHLLSLGAQNIIRKDFLQILKDADCTSQNKSTCFPSPPQELTSLSTS